MEGGGAPAAGTLADPQGLDEAVAAVTSKRLVSAGRAGVFCRPFGSGKSCRKPMLRGRGPGGRRLPTLAFRTPPPFPHQSPILQGGGTCTGVCVCERAGDSVRQCACVYMCHV